MNDGGARICAAIEAEAIATGAAVGHSVAPARHASVQHAGSRAALVERERNDPERQRYRHEEAQIAHEDLEAEPMASEPPRGTHPDCSCPAEDVRAVGLCLQDRQSLRENEGEAEQDADPEVHEYQRGIDVTNQTAKPTQPSTHSGANAGSSVRRMSRAHGRVAVPGGQRALCACTLVSRAGGFYACDHALRRVVDTRQPLLGDRCGFSSVNARVTRSSTTARRPRRRAGIVRPTVRAQPGSRARPR